MPNGAPSVLRSYCGQVAFGEVRGKNDALANSFLISSYPRLVFFCGGDTSVSFPYEVRPMGVPATW